MRVLNVHERPFSASPEQAAWLLDGLSSAEDRLWPSQHWPRLRLDRPLGPGARGGHGPIRYDVVSFEPGRKVVFEFTAPRGFVGRHWFEILRRDGSGVVLRHTIDMSLRGQAWLLWPLAIRPLHDALVEDALTNAQKALGEPATPVRWSPWVRLLRRLAGTRRRGGARGTRAG